MDDTVSGRASYGADAFKRGVPHHLFDRDRAADRQFVGSSGGPTTAIGP